MRGFDNCNPSAPARALQVSLACSRRWAKEQRLIAHDFGDQRRIRVARAPTAVVIGGSQAVGCRNIAAS